MGDHELASATTEEVESRPRPVLLVPLGATEQHGPHLPLDTDTRIAWAWAERLAIALSDTPDPVVPTPVVAPVLPYGSSGEHQRFAGTLSIGQDALRSILLELVRSAAHSFDAVVFVCGHGGNAEPLEAAVARARYEGHRVVALVPHWPTDGSTDTTGATPTAPTVDAHAGRTETSLLLHLHPDMVRLDRLAAGNTTPVRLLLDELRAGGVAAVSANGVLGDPTDASAIEGRHLLDDLVARSAATVRALLEP
jgi:creatinine amidohydrolase